MDNANLEKMSYLRAVLKETLRMHPPAILMSRMIEGPFEIAGYRIDKKVNYLPAHAFMCLSDRYVNDPMEYRPERWLRDHPLKEDVHPFVMLPFGHGPRMCVGRRFAEQEAKILVCKMVQNFRIEWHRKDLGTMVETLAKPDAPINLTLLERNT